MSFEKDNYILNIKR